MTIFCKELNQNFTDKGEMFKALKANKEVIVASKKSKIFKSFEKGIGVSAKSIDISKLDTTTKGILTDPDHYYIAVNTTKVLDSHSDLHLDGIWNKTVKDQQGRNYLLMDHKMEMTSTVAKKDKVEMFIADIPFKAVGKDYDGNTQALIYKVHKDDIIHELAKEWLESGDDIEASVRMQYVDLDLAMNSQAKEDATELKLYNDNLENIANKNEFESIDYFWVVKQAKNVGESSLVLNGSNSATGQIDNSQPLADTGKCEPLKDTQNESTTKEVEDINYFNHL